MTRTAWFSQGALEGSAALLIHGIHVKYHLLFRQRDVLLELSSDKLTEVAQDLQ
jgi:hypothetical protein